ncbi:hypothetical protein ACWCOP_13005 [Maricaulaceae bacterium MS644]
MGPKQVNNRMRIYFRNAFKNGAPWADIEDQVVAERVQGDINTLKDVLEAILFKASNTPPKLDFSGFDLQKVLTALKDQKLKDAQYTFASYCVVHFSRRSGS